VGGREALRDRPTLSPQEPAPGRPQARPGWGGEFALPRAAGEIRASFAAHGSRTRVARLYETGGLRLKFPKAADACEAVVVNTAGGIVGGDAAALSFEAGPGARVALTTQSAEKIYRSDGPPARMDVALTVGAGATLDWLPQEAIVFDNANFSRTLAADMATDARLLICESVVFGRLEMGEQCLKGAFRDRWRVRRAGKLIFAEDTRLDGEPARLLDRPAIGFRARALATVFFAAPEAVSRLDACRAALDGADCEAGVSALDGFLVARLAAVSPEHLRASILRLLFCLLGRATPRVWQ
jgi:urease accessory protein